MATDLWGACGVPVPALLTPDELTTCWINVNIDSRGGQRAASIYVNDVLRFTGVTVNVKFEPGDFTRAEGILHLP